MRFSCHGRRQRIFLPQGRGDKLAVVVLYADRSFSPEFVKTNGETRGDEEATFRLQRKRGTAAHLYCFFREKNGEAYSRSQYLGIFVILDLRLGD